MTKSDFSAGPRTRVVPLKATVKAETRGSNRYDYFYSSLLYFIRPFPGIAVALGPCTITRLPPRRIWTTIVWTATQTVTASLQVSPKHGCYPSGCRLMSRSIRSPAFVFDVWTENIRSVGHLCLSTPPAAAAWTRG